MHSSAQLKKQVLDFITKNAADCHFTALLASETWIKFASENIQLSIEIMQDVFAKMSFKC